MFTQRRRDAEKKKQALDAALKARVEEALSGPQPSTPQADVFAALRAHHEARIKTQSTPYLLPPPLILSLSKDVGLKQVLRQAQHERCWK